MLQVRCCTHSILLSDKYAGAAPLSFGAGMIFDARDENQAGDTVRYVANIHATRCGH